MESNPQRQTTVKQFTYWWEADGYVLGYLNAYPDHWTQGEDLDDLKAQLLDLYYEFSKDDLPGIRKVDELVVAWNELTWSENWSKLVVFSSATEDADIFHQPRTGRTQPVPRHREINEILARKILRDLKA